MTRVLVYGGADIEDPAFIHNSLTEVNRIYGPVTCVIHANHAQALAWQQWASRRQETRHLPIVANWRDGTEVHNRHRDRLFDQGRPDYVVVFQMPENKRDDKDAITHIIRRAQARDLLVIPYTYSYVKSLRKASLDDLVGPLSAVASPTSAEAQAP